MARNKQLPPASPAQQSPVKKHAALVCTASDSDNPTSAKKNQCLPLKQQNKDSVGLNDNYIHEQDDKSETRVVSTPRTCHICTAKSKEKDVKVKTQASTTKTPAPSVGTVLISKTVVPNIPAPPPPSKPIVSAAPAPSAPPPKPVVAVPHQPLIRSSMRPTKAS
ncbi:hypothetical protein C0995_001117 [Termitomyces sp. Mi166|nr:hypothetical protein C0995_001117 [Termitomyces sp. Mi166\